MAQNPYLVSYVVTQPTAQVPSGTLELVAALGDSPGPLTIEIPGYTLGIESMTAPSPGPGLYAYIGRGIPPGVTYTAIVHSASVEPYPDFAVEFRLEPAPAGAAGCTNPRALNYDPAAGHDLEPTLCEFVQVGALPLLAAAHLPIPFSLRASPSVGGQASVVRLLLSTAATLAGPWLEYGQLLEICDDLATATFDLSESAKVLLLTILPPVEVGAEPALSVLLKVSYEIVDPATLATTYSGEAGVLRAVNAVVQPAEGATLTSPAPYADLPTGAALWKSVVTYADGVVSARRVLPPGNCQARQFAWLNPAGAWETGYFFGRHVHGLDQADAIGYRDQSGADRYAKRGTVRDTLQVYSDKVDWATYQHLRGIRSSVQVYERLGAGKYVPVLVNSESFPEYQEQTDKVYNVNFTVGYPAQLIQTQ